MRFVDPFVPFQPGDNGFHHPDIGHAGGAAAMCPMRLPATGAPVLLLREHRGVVMALADRRFSIAVGPEYVTIGSAYRSPKDLPKLDPPATTAIRRPLGAVFGERAVERHRAPLEQAADAVLDGLTGPFDLMRDYCEPVIAAAVAISTGIPHDEWTHVLELTGQ
jgi:cytochrome P450